LTLRIIPCGTTVGPCSSLTSIANNKCRMEKGSGATTKLPGVNTERWILCLLGLTILHSWKISIYLRLGCISPYLG
jgi:hypothetical protein